MNKKQVFLVVAICALVAVLAIGGTLAWLTDKDEKVNRVTIANIGSTPEEPHWPGGEGEDDPPVPVFPGVPQSKDPYVTLDKDSDDAYVRVLVSLSDAMYAALDPVENAIFEYTEDDGTTGTLTGAAMPKANTGWTVSGPYADPNNTGYKILEYRYDTALTDTETGNKTATPAFTGFVLKEGVTAEDMEDVDMNITVVSQAIQAAGFADATAALNALEPKFVAVP